MKWHRVRCGSCALLYNIGVIKKVPPVSNNTSSGGIGLPGLLTVFFIGLKLTGYISWSWWWVLSPLWISALLAIAFLSVAFIILLLQK